MISEEEDAPKNYLWLGTNNEIEFTIDSKDGLPGNEITVGNLFIDANDLPAGKYEFIYKAKGYRKWRFLLVKFYSRQANNYSR